MEHNVRVQHSEGTLTGGENIVSKEQETTGD
jgi:hypothetical protein